MRKYRRVGFTAAQSAELWERWKRGEGLKSIGRVFGKSSIVHDFYCDVRTRKSVDVHQAFHDAMICAGVEPQRAWLMHQAVLRFGPYWTDPDPACEAAGCPPSAPMAQI